MRCRREKRRMTVERAEEGKEWLEDEEKVEGLMEEDRREGMRRGRDEVHE